MNHENWPFFPNQKSLFTIKQHTLSKGTQENALNGFL